MKDDGKWLTSWSSLSSWNHHTRIQTTERKCSTHYFYIEYPNFLWKASQHHLLSIPLECGHSITSGTQTINFNAINIPSLVSHVYPPQGKNNYKVFHYTRFMPYWSITDFYILSFEAKMLKQYYKYKNTLLMCRYHAWKLRAWKYVSEFTSFLSQRFSRYDVFTVFNSGVTPIPWTFIFQKHRKSYWQKLPCAFRERIQNGLRWYNYDTKKVTRNNYSFRKKVAIGNYCITIYCYLFAVRKSTRQRPCATKHFQFFSALNGKEPTGQIERRWRTRKDRGLM